MGVQFWGPDAQPGLFVGATPDWQLKQQAVAQGDAFKNGVPTRADGSLDTDAMVKSLLKVGAVQPALEFQQAGIAQRGVQAALQAANSLASGASGSQPSAPSSTSYVKPAPGFESAVTRTLGFEGGMNPKDTNGTPSNYGINQAAHPDVDVSSITPDQAKGIYKTQYWDAIGGDQLSPTMARAAFDTAVIAGPAKAKELLAQSGGDPMKFMDLREQFQNGLIQQDPAKYGPYQKAWAARNNGLRYDIAALNASGVAPDGTNAPAAPTANAPAALGSQAPVQVAQNGATDAPSTVHPYAAVSAPPQVSVAANALPAPQPAMAPAQPAPTAPVIDPTMGGLLTGKWVGNPGGYVSTLRADAVRLSALGQTAAASAYDKQADAVERGIERNNIITPEMKNYSVAVQQGFQGSEMDYQRAIEAQKLSAQGDPAVIRAKGQAAQAEADARNSSEIAAAGQKAEQTQEGEALGKLPGQLATAANNAKLQSNLVDQMIDAGNQFRMGPGAATQQNFNAKLTALGDAFGIDTSSIKSQVAGYTDFNKLAGQLTRQSIKETGSSRAGIQEMQMVSGSLPSPDMQKDGFQTVANQLKGLNDFTMAKQQAGDAWLNAHGTMKGFEPDWNKNVTPAAFVLHRMQVDQPAMFQTTVQRLAQTAQGRGVLANVKSGLTWGAQAGLF